MKHIFLFILLFISSFSIAQNRAIHQFPRITFVDSMMLIPAGNRTNGVMSAIDKYKFLDSNDYKRIRRNIAPFDYNELINKPDIPTGTGLEDGNYVDISVFGSGSTILINDQRVTNNKLSLMPPNTIKANLSNSTAIATDANKSAIVNWLNYHAVATSGSYIDLNNKPTIPLQFNPIAGSLVSLSGTYPNITFSVSSDNTKQNVINLTTTGSTGAATLVGSTLNIPQYNLGNGAVNLNDLNDVIITSPDTGQVLKYNGANWVNTSSGVYYIVNSTDNTDRTSELNAVLASSSFDGLIINSELDVVINGTLNIPSGKYIRFEGNSKIIGSGVINGGIIEANSLSHIFSNTLTINPEGVANGYFSARWVGANPSNSDNQPYLQKAIDICKNWLPLYIPGGNYSISKGLFVGIPNQQVQITIIGEVKSQTSTNKETVINCTHNNNFALAIQLGKGCEVSNIYFKGVNQLNYSPTTAYNPASTYLTNGSRDNQYSPYAGIVLDPFHENTPAGNLYPGFESYYPLYTTTGGSTSCNFNNITIDGFTVGRIMSPNGQTFNNESHIFKGNWIYNCKVSYVACNSQERNVTIAHELLSNSIKTGYATYGYGAGFGDPPFLNDINMGSTVFELIHWPNTGYAPFFTAQNIHAELLYRLGTLTGRFNISNSKFLFAPVDQYGYKLQSWLMSVGSGGVFSNCIMNRADNIPNSPFRIKIGNQAEYKIAPLKFVDCEIDYPSVANTFGESSYISEGYQQQFVLENCYLYQTGTKLIYKQNITSGIHDFEQYYASYGINILQTGDQISYGYGDHDASKSPYFTKHYVLSHDRKDANYYAVSMLVSGTIAKFNKTLTGINGIVKVGDPIISADTTGTDAYGEKPKGVIGVVTNITGDSVTIRIIDGVTTGTYNISILYPQVWVKPFLGDCVSGSNLITNVSGLEVNTTRITSPYFPPGAYVVSVSGDTVVMSTNATATKSNVFFSNYEYDETYYFTDNPNSYWIDIDLPVKSGTIAYNLNESSKLKKAYCVQSGHIGSTNPPLFIADYAPLTASEALAISGNLLVASLRVYVTDTSGVFNAVGWWTYTGSAWKADSDNTLDDNLLYSKSGTPTTGEISTGEFKVYKNTANSTYGLFVNDAGSISQVGGGAGSNIFNDGLISQELGYDGWSDLLTLKGSAAGTPSTIGQLKFRSYIDASNRLFTIETDNTTDFAFIGNTTFTGGSLTTNTGIIGAYHNDLNIKLNYNAVNPTTAIKFKIEDLGFAPLSVWQTGEVSIGSAAISSPNTKAILELSSTTKGFLPPRMTKTQRDAISSPATGLVIYQTDNTPGLRCYNGTNWMRYTETAD